MRYEIGNKILFDQLDRDLVVVDVGCRFGFADPFINYLDKFRLFGFDPDKKECERLQELYDKDRVTLVPLGLGNHEGSINFYVTKEPACSSIFEPDQDLTETCSALECARKVNEIEVDLTTLDLWSDKAEVKHIDHIKIDTQGSELLVLKGAKKLLPSLRTIELEVEFNPIYHNQPLFSDVDSFLRKQGFVLWKFTNLVHYGRDDEGSVVIGEDRIHHDQHLQKVKKCGGQLYWADAHYVRSEIVQAVFTSSEQLVRDIILLECLNHIDLSRRLRKILDTNI